MWRNWLGKNTHVSWLIAWLALGSILGISVAAFARDLPVDGWLLAVAGALLCVAIIKRARWLAIFAVIAGMILGFWRGSAEQMNLANYQPLYGSTVMLSGTVSEDTSYGPNGDQRIMLKDIRIGAQTLPGEVWASTNNNVTMKRSDVITVHGTLGTGFGSIAASMFYADVTNIARPKPGDIGLQARDWFAGGIRAAIPEPQASLASGYLVGQRSTLPQELDTQLKTVGLTHAVVASGYNLTILVSLARQLLANTSKYLAAFAGSTMIAGFMMISGLSPSMARAGLVTSLSLAAWYYGRKVHPFVLLPFAAAVTALINPEYVWGDIGWYLSFASFAGVIVLAPLVQRYVWGSGRVGFVKQTLVDTMAAQVATLPIMIFAFGQYSPYALLANLLVLPLVPLTMLLTFVAGVAGVIVPHIAPIVGAPATAVLHYMTGVVAHIANLPGAQGSVTITLFAVCASYAALAAIALFLWHKTRYDFHADQLAEKTVNLTET